eukprot:g1998.t1
MRAVNSSRSVAVSDAILAAQCAFDGGEFQPEAFPRCVCLLLEAFEGGDNAIRLCVARLLERFRPYFGGSVLAVEVAQRVSQLLGHHDDPTTRELCLDVLAAVAHGVGGLPRRILVDIGRSLRSLYLSERQAAARAYASCMCVQRSASSSSSLELLTPRTLEDMAALSSALLPMLSWGGGGGGGDDWIGDARVSALIPARAVGMGERTAVTARGDGDSGGGGGNVGYGSHANGVEGLLESVLWKVTGDLPSTELWESLKVFLLDDDTASSSSSSSSSTLSRGTNITALVDLVLYRVRSNGSPSRVSISGNGGSNPVLRAIAVDFFVALIQMEAVERSKFARAAAEAAVEAAAAADAAAAAGASSTSDPNAATPAKKAAPKAPSVAAAPTPGRSAVWSLLGALSASETEAEKIELLSVLGAPALAVAVVDAEAVAGAKSAAKMAAAHGFGEGGGVGGASGGSRVSEAHGKARIRFPLATAAVEKFRQLSPAPSSSSSSSSAAALMLACASSLVSFAVATFRETPHYPASGSISGGAARRDKAMSALAEIAADGLLSSPPVVGLLSAGGGGGGGDGAMVRSLVLPQLRALAAVHAWPRRRVWTAVVRGLAEARPGSPLAVDLAVLASQVVRAGEQDSHGAEDEDGEEAEKVLWELLFARRFCDQNPKAAVGIAVALMRYHRGPLSRQSTLSGALVGAMGGGGDCDILGGNDEKSESSATPVNDERKASRGRQSGAGGEGSVPSSNVEGTPSGGCESCPEGGDPIVRDTWFQLVLCRECMLHGFYEAAEAGLRRLRQQAGGAGARGPAVAVPTSDAVWVWTEVLGKISAAETFFGGSSDPVAAHACAAHEIALAAELLASLPHRGSSGTGRRSPQAHQHPSAAWQPGGEASGNGIAGSILSGGGGNGRLFKFQRSFLEARAELLRLLGACWGMCQDLSATRTNRYARFSRREARCRRLPAAFRKLAGDFRLLRALAPGAGPTTTEPLRAACCLCLFLAIAADALLSQGKSVLVGSREKSMTKKSWRAWLERLVAGGPGAGGVGGQAEEEEEEGAGNAAGVGSEGALMKAVRVLGARLLGLSDPPKAPIGRVAFSSILESVRGTPFPMPRAFFRTGVTPRVALTVLPPAPPALAPATMTGPDGGMVVDGSSGNTGGGAWSGGHVPSPQQQHHRQMSDELASPPSSAPGATAGGDGLTVGEKRQRRDGGLGAKYYGPSCRLRADVVEAERSRLPRLPLMSAPAPAGATPTAPKNRKSSRSCGAPPARDLSSPSFSASETWWAQTVREEVMFPVSGGLGGVYGGGAPGGNGGWRAHALTQMGSPGVWLLQGTVCRGRGAGGALPGVSEVVLKISVGLTGGTENGGAEGTFAASGVTTKATPAIKSWSTQVVAQTFGAAADTSTALCFRAQVHMPALALSAAPNVAATADGGGRGGGGVMEVAVCLKGRGKEQKREERATSTGFAALGSAGGGGNHGIGAARGDEEAWVVGNVSVPLPATVPATGMW